MTKVTSPRVIAVVDDDALFRRTIARLLRSGGFRVEAFESAEAFLAERSADVVCAVLDVKLPGMSGVDLQRDLVLEERPPSIVFVSAHDDQDIQSNVLQAGAIAFLKKPFENSALIDAIEVAIRRHHESHG